MVYFLLENIESGHIKVGHAKKLYGKRGRLETLQVGNPRRLLPIATIDGNNKDSKKLEKQIKKDLNDYNVRGEWFYADSEVLDYIRKIQGFRLRMRKPDWYWSKEEKQLPIRYKW